MLRAPPFVLLALFACSVRSLTAQFAVDWSAGDPMAFAMGNGRCSTQWDPDGAGPLPNLLVVGGSELAAGSFAANQRLVTWDGSQGTSLGDGPGTGGLVGCLAVWNGQLVAGLTQTSVALGSLLPQGQPGCTQLTWFDIAMFLPAVGGIARSQLAPPLDPLLLGVNCSQQSIVVELDGTGALGAQFEGSVGGHRHSVSAPRSFGNPQ